jgi:hypothetical protein
VARHTHLIEVIVLLDCCVVNDLLWARHCLPQRPHTSDSSGSGVSQLQNTAKQQQPHLSQRAALAVSNL